MARIQERNNSFIAWFKKYRAHINLALKEYLAETGKEKLRFKADIHYEKSLYKIQLQKIQKIGKSEKTVKTKLNQEQKYNKDFAKRNKKEMTNTDGSIRKNIEIGCYVEIVQKHHQRSGELNRRACRANPYKIAKSSAWYKSKTGNRRGWKS